MEDVEDTEFVASEHDRLISAVSKLDKTQHITQPTRNEPTHLSSEFNLIKRSNKLDLSNVVKVLGETAHNVEIGKKLKKTQEASKVLPKPLEKPQAERIKRATGYEDAKKKVGRWDPVVARSRTLDYVSYPIKHVSHKMQPTDEFLSKLVLKSSLEKALDEVDPPPAVEEKDEDEQLYPMSYEEMLEHRQQLAKMRAQQSYKAAKAKRQSKIKSKKYHRILKKERLKTQLKEFEELQQKDPEEALKKLEALEKARALERHTLRHKNTGKWAKSKLVRAKYDKDVRQELAEQLAVSRGLTHKTKDVDSSDDEPENNESDPILLQDPLNPWMMRRSDKSNVDSEFDFGYKKYVQGRMFKKKEESDDSEEEQENNQEQNSNGFQNLKDSIKKLNVDQDDSNESESDINIKSVEDSKDNSDESASDIEEPVVKRSKKSHKLKVADKITTRSQSSKKAVATSDSDKSAPDIVETIVKIKKSNKPKANDIIITRSQSKKAVATSNWVVEPININGSAENNDVQIEKEVSTAFDSYESNIANMVEKKLKKIRQNIEQLEKHRNNDKKKKRKTVSEQDNLEYLKFKQQTLKPVIDEELIETSSKNINDEAQNSTTTIHKPTRTLAQDEQSGGKVVSNIDPNRFMAVKPKYLKSVIPEGETDYDQLDDEQVVPKVNIEDVFEEDDVVDSFRQEKEDEINKDKPEDIDLRLPGWGSWGGKGVKAPRRRKSRFILKAPPAQPRRDENKGDIIIKEYRDPKLAVHKVTEVPFPFSSVKDYEASIRAPLGNTFIPEKAHKRLIKPSVITKAGAIIEPMDEEELLIPKNRKFKNESVIKLLGQK